MASFKIAMDKTFTAEGVFGNKTGYVFCKDDAGGETNWGITKATALANGYTNPMMNMTKEEAIQIYKKCFWDTINGDLIDSQSVANELFDTGVNVGIGFAGVTVQRVLNVLNRYQADWPDLKVDGGIGSQTISILNKATAIREDNILKALNIIQGAKYIELAENPARRDEANVNGWLSHRVQL